MRLATMPRLRWTPRPWVLRAIVLTVVYGVAQTAFVALRSLVPDLLTLWSVLLLAVVLAVGILWVGAEVVLDRRPPDWTWFWAALASAPGAGLLSWILNALFVDDTGVADLQSALVGRASFTALLVLASVGIGSRLGWLSLHRHGEGADDPALDADDEAVSRQAALDRAGVTEPAAPARTPRPGPSRAPREAVGPTVAGVRTPRRRARPEAPEVEERERLPEAPRLAGERRASRVRAADEVESSPAPAEAAEPATPAAPSSPFGPAPATPPAETVDEPESLAPPVVAVLPTTELPVPPVQAPPEPPPGPSARPPADRQEPAEEPAPADPAALRRRFGLRRPGR